MRRARNGSIPLTGLALVSTKRKVDHLHPEGGNTELGAGELEGARVLVRLANRRSRAILGPMVLTNVEVVRDQYAATNARDWKRAMSHYAEDAVLVIHGEGIRAGTYDGKEEVGRWFGDWFGTFDRDGRFEILEIAEIEDGGVAVVADYHARGRVSGVEVRGMVAWRYGFRDGKIIRLEGNTTFNQMSPAEALEQLYRQGRNVRG